jgi:hypothetical protein
VLNHARTADLNWFRDVNVRAALISEVDDYRALVDAVDGQYERDYVL